MRVTARSQYQTTSSMVAASLPSWCAYLAGHVHPVFTRCTLHAWLACKQCMTLPPLDIVWGHVVKAQCTQQPLMTAGHFCGKCNHQQQYLQFQSLLSKYLFGPYISLGRGMASISEPHASGCRMLYARTHEQPCPCNVHMYLAMCHELPDGVQTKHKLQLQAWQCLGQKMASMLCCCRTAA